MLNKELLKSTIKDTGLSVTFIAKKLNISREGLYKKLNGDTEFKGSEIYELQNLLHLSRLDRDRIFFANTSDLKSHKKNEPDGVQ